MNLANKLTLLRILLIPVFIVVYNVTGIGIATASVFVIASLTDTLDGYIARSRKLVTTFGKFADPLADKILVTAALIQLVGSNLVPAWAVILIIAREFIVTGFRILAASANITIAASPLGKLKTISQFIAIILLLLGNPFFGSLRVDLFVFYLALFLTVLSGADYLWKNRQVLDLSNL